MAWALLRDIIIADTDEEARQLWIDSATFAGNAWFVPFGFRRGMLDPQTGEAPTPEEAIAKGYALVGDARHGNAQPGSAAPQAAGELDFRLDPQHPGAARQADAVDRTVLHRGAAACALARVLAYG